MLVTSAFATFAFAWAWYEQYFKKRDCFNELGRCFDAETGVVYHAQSGIVWLGLAIVGAVLSVALLARIIRKEKATR